jgi:hypothetical protein
MVVKIKINKIMKHFKSLTKVNIDKYKEDIEGILIELKDGFEFDIVYNDGYWDISF